MKTFQTLCLPLLASLLLGLGCLSGNARGDTLADFSDLTLPNAAGQTQYAPDNTTVTGYYWSGPDPNGSSQSDGYGGTLTVGQFTSGGVAFPNIYDANSTYGSSWSGWAYSNVNDTTTPGYGNQDAAHSATGGGVNGAGSIYAVAYGATSAGGAPPTITLPTATAAGTVLSAEITNTTYAYLSMLNGDSFENAFGPSDWFLLTISAFDAAGQPTGTPVDFYLAKDGEIVNDWTNVNLSSLGAGVKSLQFDLTSSKNSGGYMDTPAYFALGALDLNVVPEPSTFALLGGGVLAGLVAWRRRRPKDRSLSECRPPFSSRSAVMDERCGGTGVRESRLTR